MYAPGTTTSAFSSHMPGWQVCFTSPGSGVGTCIPVHVGILWSNLCMKVGDNG